MKLKCLKSIQYLSYIILIENFLILFINNTGCINAYTFVWMMVISLLLCLDICKKKIVQIIFSILLFVPLIFQDGITNRVMITAACIIVLCLRKKVDKETTYEQISYPMKVLIPSAIGMLLLSYLVPDKQQINEFIMPYVIIHMVVSILILRIMRDFKYGALDKKAIEVRSICISLIMIFFAVCSMKQVRAAIVKVIDVSCSFLGKILYFFESKIINFSGEVVRKIGFDVDWSKINSTELKSASYEMDGVQTSDGEFWKMQGVIKAAYIIPAIIILVLLLYCLFRVLYWKRKKKHSDFVETREHIDIRENIVNKTNKKLYLKLKNGNYKDKIRYYYYRFLRDCIRKDVALNVSDTTYEINNKAKAIFNKQSLEQMRNIYLKAKYTEYECTVNDFERFHENYKEK